MKRMLIALALLAAAAAQAAGPARNLLVELRWVAVDAAAQGGARGGLSLGTASLDAGGGESAVQRLIVLNGRQAGVSLREQWPVQWLDYGVELSAVGGSGGGPGRGDAGRQAGAATVYAAPRTTLVESLRGFSVTPQWPGGREPVRVEFRASTPAAGGQAEIYGTVQAPLQQWVAVARSGPAPQRPEPGVISSRDAQAAAQRELQLRISVAP
ncbi:hypothetical protein [Roseateles violae]|uniref:Uncharacterized protein n=1 Tax=Roseateles violae TaxID=3058042 RepID=A0ABT8DMQ8_9BURK|nr:hypothetical protein [Pelomonas sp. PFR6]MDN3919674.1 hypothetical protein [Pelomonas sp. PFR6]